MKKTSLTKFATEPPLSLCVSVNLIWPQNETAMDNRSELRYAQYRVKAYGWRIPHYSNAVTTTQVLLLQLSGDVEANPGPAMKSTACPSLRIVCLDFSTGDCLDMKDSIEWYSENINSYHKSNIKFGHLNINSIQNKMDEVRDMPIRNMFDILFIAEMKIDSTYSDDLFRQSGYHTKLI